MGKVCLFFLVVSSTCLLSQSTGYNYYWQTNPGAQDLLSYPFLPSYSPVWQPDCSKNKDSSESDSSESSESSSESESDSSSSEGSSSESSEESSNESGSKESTGEGGEGGGEEGSKEGKGSEEGEGSTSAAEGEGSSSKEEGGSKSSEGSSEGSTEEKKKEAPKKKKKKESKSLFPPRAYTFPARPVQRIIYSPSPYAYMQYRSPYVVQQPVANYPVKTSFQYVSVPASAAVVNKSPVIRKVISSPVQRIVYSPSPAVAYSPVSKTVISPGASVYSVSGSLTNPLILKK